MKLTPGGFRENWDSPLDDVAEDGAAVIVDIIIDFFIQYVSVFWITITLL